MTKIAFFAHAQTSAFEGHRRWSPVLGYATKNRCRALGSRLRGSDEMGGLKEMKVVVIHESG